MDKEFIVYTRRIAYELRVQGFKIIRTEVNPNFPQYDTYVFENSSELQNAFRALTRK